MAPLLRLPSMNYLLSACFLLLWGVSRADDQNKDLDVALKDRFLHEAPHRWVEYEARLQYLLGNQRIHNTLQNPDARVEINIAGEWKANETCKLFISDFQQQVNGKVTKPPIKATGANSRYGFTLERKTKDSPWLLTQIVQDNLADFIQREFPKGYPEFYAVLITFELVRLKDIVKRKEFQITACREMTVDGEALAEITFDFDNKGIEETFLFRGGKLVLDPQRFWCLRSYESRVRHPAFQGTSVFKVLEREETEGSFTWPKRVVIESHFDHAKKTQEYEFVLQIPAKSPPEEEFALAAFGLPEPTWLAARPKPWYLIIGGAGTACLGVFFFLRTRARRARQ